MKGWKTKTGAILTTLGGVLVSSAESVSDEVGVWLALAGKVLMAVGGPLAAWGLGHKIDKASGND